MACSKYEYVKGFEIPDPILPNCWIVVRIDGRGFTKFSELHKFEKPNDIRALELMNKCAEETLSEFKDIVIAFGESDEYSFVFRKDTSLWGRRASKITTAVVSFFSSCYVFHWSKFFDHNSPLQQIPTFDGRAVAYPSDQNLRDYLSWRQVDCHVNNQYNTCFWNLVLKGGHSKQEAQNILKGTLADFKNELLFNRFEINYSKLPAIFRKGSVVLREQYIKVKPPKPGKDGASANEASSSSSSSSGQKNEGVTEEEEVKGVVQEEGEGEVKESKAPVVGEKKMRNNPKIRWRIVTIHDDIIADDFWNQRPYLMPPS